MIDYVCCTVVQLLAVVRHTSIDVSYHRINIKELYKYTHSNTVHYMNSEIVSNNIIIRIHGASMTRLIGFVVPPALVMNCRFG